MSKEKFRLTEVHEFSLETGDLNGKLGFDLLTALVDGRASDNYSIYDILPSDDRTTSVLEKI